MTKRKMKVSPPLVIGGVVLLLLLVGGYFLFFGGGGDGDGDGSPVAGLGSGKKGSTPARPAFNPKPAPVVSSGTVDTARREGAFAVAQARGTVRRPSRISLRVSAAPKQVVTVNWQLGCFVNRRTAYGRGHYRTRTPDTRAVPLPSSGAVSCIATAGAQLTREGNGRVKVIIIAG